MLLKSWSNRKSNPSASYGFYFPIDSYRQFVMLLPEVTSIYVILRDGSKYTQKLTASFFRNCHEIRNKNIREYFTKNNSLNWEQGKPHEFQANFEGVSLTISEIQQR